MLFFFFSDNIIILKQSLSHQLCSRKWEICCWVDSNISDIQNLDHLLKKEGGGGLGGGLGLSSVLTVQLPDFE